MNKRLKKIWKPAGMEAMAYWNTDTHGFTLAHGFLSARLRDFLRFGQVGFETMK